MESSGHRQTLDEIKELVEEVLEFKARDDQYFFQAAVVLLSCISVGPNADRITKFTGYDRDRVRRIARRIRAAGIWCGRGADSAMDIGPWMDEKSGDLAFTLDAMIANGELKKDGDRYKLTQKGIGRARTAARRNR